jgi:organic hydroperoxide reductase OsmC/OhrA
MSLHHVTIGWQRNADQPFSYDDYSRDHAWTFGTGTRINASAAAQYRGNPALPNPEEALVGALSSCHMLSFLAICARKKIVIERYDDAAEGTLAFNAERKMALTAVTLRPTVVYAEPAPNAIERARLHDQAHAECFIASSVKTIVTIEHD